MNIIDMYTLVNHPTVKRAYTFLHAKKGHRHYGLPAPAYFFDRVIDGEIFYIKNTVIAQKSGKIVTGYYLPKNGWSGYSFKKVLKELEDYYSVEIPSKKDAVYIDYLRSHVVYKDGLTLKLKNGKVYEIPPAPLAVETGLNVYYSAEDGTYGTITGAEIIVVTGNKIELIIGYKKVAHLTPELLHHMIELGNTDDIKTLIALL